MNWTLINKTAKGLAQGIVDAINAALQTEDLWKKIGTAISNAINSAILFAKTFVTGLDWASLGTAIGNLLGNAIVGIDYVGIGETFAGFVNGVFTAVLNFSKTFPWKGYCYELCKRCQHSTEKTRLEYHQRWFRYFL